MSRNISRIQLLGWNALVTTIILLVFVWGIQFTIKAEQMFFPVVEDAQIVKLVRERNQILIWGTFNKVRECTFKHIVVRDNTPGANPVYLPIDLSPFGDPQPVRHEGEQSFGPWAIPIKTNNAKHISMIVLHNCGFPWHTVTHMTDFMVPNYELIVP